MSGLYLVGLVLLALGVFLVIRAGRGRAVQGLGKGKTLALDNVTLFSERLGLVGRPDRLVKDGEHVIPEEWKSSKRLGQGHKLQLGAYFLLIEEKYGVRPPHGFVVLGDGSRVQVENTEALRSEVLQIADNIRFHRANLSKLIRVRKPAAMCRVCGQRKSCGQSEA